MTALSLLLLFSKLNQELSKNIASPSSSYSDKVTHIGSVDTNKHTVQFIEEGESESSFLPFLCFHLDHLHSQ